MNVTSKISTVTEMRQVEVKKKTIVLEMSVQEAKFLKALIGRVGSSPRCKNGRLLADEIFQGLEAQGIDYSENPYFNSNIHCIRSTLLEE